MLLAELGTRSARSQRSSTPSTPITAEAMSYLREYRVPFNDIALLPQALDKLDRCRLVAGDRRDRGDPIVPFAHRRACGSAGKTSAKSSRDWRRRGNRLPDLRDLSKHLGRAIQNGEVDENYSPELRQIRRALGAARSRLTDKLESIVRSPAYSSQLQDQLVTVRNGRFVIPVRTEAKARRRRHRSWQLFQRRHGFHGTAGRSGNEQRAGAAAGRRAVRNRPNSCRTDGADSVQRRPDRICAFACRHTWNWFLRKRDSAATSIAGGPSFRGVRCSA